jgi:uroporphyrinogen decarboxylase
MNGYERIVKVLRGEAVDRTPIMLHNFMPAAKEAGFTMKQFRSSPENMAKSFLIAVEKYGFDGILTDVDTALEANALGALTDFPENDPARVIGPAGKNFEEIIQKVDPQKLLTDERIQIYLEAIRLMKKQVGGEVFIRGNADQGAFSLAMLLYGMEDFLAELMDEDEKENLLKLIAKCFEVHLKFHKMIMEAGADATSFGDSSCGPDLISRSMYLEFANPFHRRLKKALDDSGINCICHICGNLDKILEDVAEVGFAGVEVDYKTNIANAHEILKGKSVMFGPLDPSGVFFFGSIEDVRRKAEEVLEIFKDGGLVIGAGCALPVNTPEANLRAFVETVKQKGVY